MPRMPDNPRPVSLQFLRTLDTHAPGTYFAQAKLDGFRRMAYRVNGQWSWFSKPNGTGCYQRFDADVRTEFEALPWPDSIALDVEWCGPRRRNTPHSLYVFDVIDFAVPFADRLNTLAFWMLHRGCQSERVRFVPAFRNPGFVDLFEAQRENPLSEGLVIRRADCRLIGAMNRCSTNPHMWKVKFVTGECPPAKPAF